MAKLTHEMGYYSCWEVGKLRKIFNDDKGRCGIVVNSKYNAHYLSGPVLTIESDKYADKVEMLQMFSAILAKELLEFM